MYFILPSTLDSHSRSIIFFTAQPSTAARVRDPQRGSTSNPDSAAYSFYAAEIPLACNGGSKRITLYTPAGSYTPAG